MIIGHSSAASPEALATFQVTADRTRSPQTVPAAIPDFPLFACGSPETVRHLHKLSCVFRQATGRSRQYRAPGCPDRQEGSARGRGVRRAWGAATGSLEGMGARPGEPESMGRGPGHLPGSEATECRSLTPLGEPRRTEAAKGRPEGRLSGARGLLPDSRPRSPETPRNRGVTPIVRLTGVAF